MNAAAPFIFFMGIAVGMWCGARIFVRAYQFMQALGRTPKWDPAGDIVRKIRLKDTFVRDVIGWLIGIIIVNIAIHFLSR
jgi:hypothetical protein